MPRKPGAPHSGRHPPGTEFPSGSVSCALCGRAFRTLGNHLRSVHGTTARAYRERFPGAVTISAESRETCRINARHGLEVLTRQGGRTKKVTYEVA